MNGVGVGAGVGVEVAPLYRIDPRSDVGGQTEAKSGEVFYGRTEERTADKKRSKNFVLGSPLNYLLSSNPGSAVETLLKCASS